MAAAVGPGVAVGVAVRLAHGVADIEAEGAADADADAEAESEGEGVLSLLPQAAATARTATKVSARRVDRDLCGDGKGARVGRIVCPPSWTPCVPSLIERRPLALGGPLPASSLDAVNRLRHRRSG